MRLIETLRRSPKQISAFVAVVAAVITVPAALLAFGPDRPTFTTANPADHVTFNSITDNPAHGDERNFVQVKEASAPNSAYAENANLKAGKQYTVFMYYHNNAASNLNASGKGIAKGVNVRAEIPAVVKNGGAATHANGFVSASNASPKTVFDDVSFKNTTGGDIALRYVPGSATIHNKGKVNGAKLSDNIITTGAPIGYDSLNGVVPGCNDFAGYVTFNIVADQPNFDITKQVRKLGEDSSKWRETAAVSAGDKVEYLIHYNNTGTTQQNDVTIKDMLPKGVTYVPGTTKLQNSNFPGGKSVSDNVISTNGLNISDYAPKAGAYVWFTAKVDAKDKLVCGPNKLVNKATVETNNGSKDDTADVTVDGDKCQPPVKEAKFTCDALSVQRLSRTSFKFDTAYTVENATFKSVTYVVRDAQGNELYRGQDANYTQTTAGSYSVQAIVTVSVNGQDKTVTSDNCKKMFEVVPENKDIKVCELDTKNIITINEKDFDANKHSINLDDCKETPVTPPVTPETPTELPETGMGGMVMQLTGMFALAGATAYYVASRRI